jgi:hypothetical protein
MSKEKDVDKLKYLKKQVTELTKKFEALGTTYVGDGMYASRQDVDIRVKIIKTMSEVNDMIEKRIEALEKANK